MKKLTALLMAMVMLMTFAACGSTKDDPSAKSEGVSTHEEFLAAEDQSLVTIEAYVQATQSWWDNKITIYAQDPDGGYFLYNMACTEDEAAKLTPGTKIKATGSKTTWSGEVEIMEGEFEIIEGSTWTAEALDVTDKLSTDELINHQNEKVAFKGLTVEASTDADGNEAAFLYNYDGSGEAGSNSDLYFKASVGGNTYGFCVESYLCGEGTDVYTAVENLNIGDTIDMEGFLYWYEGAEPHITAVTVK